MNYLQFLQKNEYVVLQTNFEIIRQLANNQKNISQAYSFNLKNKLRVVDNDGLVAPKLKYSYDTLSQLPSSKLIHLVAFTENPDLLKRFENECKQVNRALAEKILFESNPSSDSYLLTSGQVPNLKEEMVLFINGV